VAGPEEVSLDAGGFPIRVKGLNMLVVAILAVALGYIVWDTRVQIASHHSAMVGQSQNLQETMDEFVYIQSLQEDERMKLKLSMPDSLRRKVRLSAEGR